MRSSRPMPTLTGQRRSWPIPSTSPCRPVSPALRSTWRWRSSASCAAPTSGTSSWSTRRRAARRSTSLTRRSASAGSLAGGGAGLLMINAGFGVVTGIVTKVIGGQMLRDVQTFVSAMDTMFGGFRERADYTYRLLRAPDTAFLVIAAPEPDALREASYFVERLAQEGMPLAGLILNRVHRSPAAGLSAVRSLAAAETLLAAAGPSAAGTSLAIAALRLPGAGVA